MLQRQLSDQKQSAEAFDIIADMVVEETEPDAAEQPEETGETEAPARPMIFAALMERR